MYCWIITTKTNPWISCLYPLKASLYLQVHYAGNIRFTHDYCYAHLPTCLTKKSYKLVQNTETKSRFICMYLDFSFSVPSQQEDTQGIQYAVLNTGVVTSKHSHQPTHNTCVWSFWRYCSFLLFVTYFWWLIVKTWGVLQTSEKRGKKVDSVSEKKRYNSIIVFSFSTAPAVADCCC